MEIIVILSLLANLLAIYLVILAYTSYRKQNYSKAFTELLFCIALATLFNIKVS